MNARPPAEQEAECRQSDERPLNLNGEFPAALEQEQRPAGRLAAADETDPQEGETERREQTIGGLLSETRARKGAGGPRGGGDPRHGPHGPGDIDCVLRPSPHRPHGRPSHYAWEMGQGRRDYKVDSQNLSVDACFTSGSLRMAARVPSSTPPSTSRSAMASLPGADRPSAKDAMFTFASPSSVP